MVEGRQTFVRLSQPAQAQKIWEYILAEAADAEPAEKSVYSDLGFILLGSV